MTIRLRGVARGLRKQPTEAERRLWQLLRRRGFGARFSRQVPIGPFVVDFACHEQRLVVEVDGGEHADNPSDVRRTAWLAGAGYRVVRFWNDEVLANPEGVYERLTSVVRLHPPPRPSPSRGEGDRQAEVEDHAKAH